MKKTTAILLIIVMLVASVSVNAAAFSDVGKAYDWAAEAIEKFSGEGIVEGKGGGRFAPDDFVTRAEFAKMLTLTFALETSGEGNAFQDVDDNSWSAPYIAAAVGYTVPIDTLDEVYAAMDTNNYAPEREATREEIAAALVNMFPPSAYLSFESIKNKFEDSSDVNQALYESVARAYSMELIKGCDDGTLRPKASVTRAEAVVMLDRAREKKRLLETQTPNPSAEPSTEPTPAAMPKAEEDIISVVSISQISVNGEECYALYYAFGGVPAKEPLVVSGDVLVTGLKKSIYDIDCGDLVLFDMRTNGKVRTLFVMFSPGKEAPADEASAGDLIRCPSGQSWKLSASGISAYYTVYFGRIIKTKETGDGVVVYLERGGYSDAALVRFDTEHISVYEPYQNKNENRFKKIAASRLQGSYELNSELVFMRAKKDIITDVIVFDYKK